jgi:hypothetical protein
LNASNGWLHRTLKRHGKVEFAHHGEDDDIAIEERNKMIDDRKKTTFQLIIEKFDVTPSCIYNADQPGLFHQKLPSRIYVDKSSKKNYAGAKQMKDETRIAVILVQLLMAVKSHCPLLGNQRTQFVFGCGME